MPRRRRMSKHSMRPTLSALSPMPPFLAPAFGKLGTTRLLVRVGLVASARHAGAAARFRNFRFPTSARRAAFSTSSARPVTHLVANEIADPLAAIAQELQRAGVDEISEKNAVPSLHFRSHRI